MHALHSCRRDVEVGLGLKVTYLANILDADQRAIDFVEVHAENYLCAGGPMLRHLQQVRDCMDLSVHGVGLSIGGEAPPDPRHMQRLKQLLDRFEPRWFSEHLAWSSHGGTWFNDLLPLPYNRSNLQRVCDHIDEIQRVLGRPLLLENPSTYVEFEASTLDEASFLNEVARRTGCGLLLDVNNAFISAVNHGRDARPFIDALPAAAIGEIHLAGFARDLDAAGAPLLIDTHGAPIDAAVWSLFEHAVQRLGPRPTLIERDNNLPPFDTLRAEAQLARQTLQAARQGSLPTHLERAGT